MAYRPTAPADGTFDYAKLHFIFPDGWVEPWRVITGNWLRRGFAPVEEE